MINFMIPLTITVIVVALLLRPRKNTSKPSKIAILATTVPLLILGVAAVIFQLLHNAAGTVEVSDISNICFIVGLGWMGAAILVSIGFALTRKGEVAKGIGFGVCIAFIISIFELMLLEWSAGV
jgi:hypothetical protein